MPHHQSYESQITLISSNLLVQRLTRAHWQVNTLGWLHGTTLYLEGGLCYELAPIFFFYFTFFLVTCHVIIMWLLMWLLSKWLIVLVMLLFCDPLCNQPRDIDLSIGPCKSLNWQIVTDKCYLWLIGSMMWHLWAGTLSAGIYPEFPLCFTYLSPGCFPFALMSWQ